MRATTYPRIKALAASRSGLITGLIWGVAEALFWPIIPDYYVFAVTPANPARWWRVAAFTSAGSVIGGCFGFWWAYTFEDSTPLRYAPLVTAGMVAQAETWLTDLGSFGVIYQPLSGVPYKVFVFLAGSERLSFPIFLWTSVVARATRIFAVALIAGGLGRLAGERRMSRVYDIFLVVFTAVFVYGLWRVVATYS